MHYGGEMIVSTGHGFSGMSRHTLLRALQQQAAGGGCAARVRARGRRRSTSSPARTWSSAPTASTARFGGCSAIAVRDRASTCGRTASSGWARPSRFPSSRSTSNGTSTGCGACTPTSTRRVARRSSSSAATRPGALPGMDAPSEEERAAFLEALFAEELAGIG